MRSKYYEIQAYCIEEGERVEVCGTDYGLIAWFMWWKIKMSSRYLYPLMQVRAK